MSEPSEYYAPDDVNHPLYGTTLVQARDRFIVKFLDFKGRASRSEFWFAQLFLLLPAAIPDILIGIALFRGWTYRQENPDAFEGGSRPAVFDAGSGTYVYKPRLLAAPGAEGLFALGCLLLSLLFLVVLVGQLALHWRRLHDANLAGPFFFLSFIPVVGALIVLVLMMLPSTSGGRRFDREPPVMCGPRDRR